MIEIDILAKQLQISTETMLKRLENFMTYAQVHLADLEDAIATRDYKRIVYHTHKIALRASKLHLHPITAHTEHIEILATFKRETDYELLFAELRQALLQLYESIRLYSQMLPG